MKLNKKLEIGVNVVSVLKRRGVYTKAADIAAEVGTTVPFLSQIMRELRTAGIVSVKRGKGGGYLVASDKSVTAYEVANAVGRELSFVETDDSVATRLRRSVVNAYQTTTI